MKTYSYNKEILISTAQMLMLFNNINIRRNNTNINVPCVNGQRSRILKFLQNPEGSTFTLPMSYLVRGNITYNASRSANIHNNIFKKSDYEDFNPDSITPVPIDIEYKISFITKYPDDMDMLISNFVPFFHKDVYVTSPHPKLEGRTIKHQIVWSGSIDTIWPEELQNIDADLQISNTSFIYKTQLFGGSGYLQDTTGLIYTIDMTLSPSTAEISASYSTSGGNILGGFYPVPYSENFAAYVQKILDITNTEYIEDPQRDEFIYNVYNDAFNVGVAEGRSDVGQRRRHKMSCLCLKCQHNVGGLNYT
jgi:hypothetical protein